MADMTNVSEWRWTVDKTNLDAPRAMGVTATTSSASEALKCVEAYTDGACIGNPGPGGYAAVLRHGAHQRVLSGGYRKTTNNRMELLAAVKALEALKEKCKVTLYSDSQYVVRMMQGQWPQKWRAHGWWRSRKERASNPDLWAALVDLCDAHEVEFVWVRGHAGNADNERCDRLAMSAALQADLPPDEGYELASEVPVPYPLFQSDS